MLSNVILLVVLALSAAAQSPTFSEREPRYRIQPNDVLDLQYRFSPEFNQTVAVHPDGFVTLYIAGDVKVGGLTLDQIRKTIVDKMAVRLRDPELMITLKEFEKPYFVVAGEVMHPGRFDLRESMTAIQGIAIGGGFNEKSKRSQVLLIRKVKPDLGEVKVLNLKHMMSSMKANEDVGLQSGDILVVPQTPLVKIERYIKWANVGVFWSPMPR